MPSPADLPPLISYPCDYEFKIIGPGTQDFADFATDLVTGVLGLPPAEADRSVRVSSAGKFHAVSVRVKLQNEAQRVAVYVALSKEPRIVFYL